MRTTRGECYGDEDGVERLQVTYYRWDQTKTNKAGKGHIVTIAAGKYAHSPLLPVGLCTLKRRKLVRYGPFIITKRTTTGTI